MARATTSAARTWRVASPAVVGLGGPEVLVLLLVLLAGNALPIWALVDAAMRPEPAFVAAGQNKIMWVVLNAVGIFACVLGLIVAIVYLTSIRPKVVAAQRGGV